MPSGLKQDLSIGANLKRLREGKGYRQEQVIAKLAEYGIFIQREVLSQIENGRHSVRITVLLSLKDLYKASYEDIFSGLSVGDVKKLLLQE